MISNKRGISPLIATVLIIGFTVALAAVIMVWGQGFIKDMQAKTESGAAVQLVCAQDVTIDLSQACLDSTTDQLRITVKNNGNKDIKKLTVRAYESASLIGSSDVLAVAPATVALPAFGVETIDIEAAKLTDDGLTLANLRQAEVIPIVEIGGKEVSCAQSGSLYPVGALPTDKLPAC